MGEVCFGWKAGPEQFGPHELIEYSMAAEQAGFDLIDMSDHFHPWDPSGQSAFTWTVLGVVAGCTSRVRIGPGVTCPIIRYHPSVIAQASATLETLAPGRTYLAVGTGEALNEYAATGVWPSYRRRQEMLGEAIDLIRLLWTGEEVSFEGYYYSTRKARLYTRPDVAPPLYVSTLVPDSAGFAGEKGDGLITTGGQQPEVYRKIQREFEQAARTHDKDTGRMPRMIEIPVAFTDDAQSTVQHMKQYWAGAMVPALFNRKIYSPQESAENGKVVGQDTVEKSMCISADPEKHVEHVRSYLDQGFDTIIFHCPDPDQRAFLEAYGSEVLPRLRDVARARAA